MGWQVLEEGCNGVAGSGRERCNGVAGSGGGL